MRITPSKSKVRWLVALEILLLVAGVFVEEAEPSPASPFDTLSSSGYGIDGGDRLSLLQILVGVPLFLFGVAAYAGVLRFKSWGRKCYLLYHVLDVAAHFIPGEGSMPAAGAVMYVASYFSAAMVLYLLYFTPLKELFQKKGAAEPGPAAPEVPGARNEEHPVDQARGSSGEKETGAHRTESRVETGLPSIGDLAGRLTDRLFPKTAEARAVEEPPEQKKKRRTLLLWHYVFILVFMLAILMKFNTSGLVVVALCFVVYNLAQRKGGPFAVLFPLLVAGFGLLMIFFSLFGFMLSSFSKDFLPYLLPYISAWILLIMLEARTHKFARDIDQPDPHAPKDEASKVPKP
jgi:hypothetical protein